jgi:nucleotide-binding universal stress UspA family protein
MAPEAAAEVLTGVKELAALKIAGLMKSNYRGDVPYQAIVQEGAIDDTLLEIVERKGVDLVVLGTHGRRGLDQLMLGSVAEKVFRLARCPVLTVGPNVTPFTPEAPPFKHILYPMELSADVPDAAAHARTIVKNYDAELTFLNVIKHSLTTSDERAWINMAAQHWFDVIAKLPESPYLDAQMARVHLKDLITPQFDFASTWEAAVELGSPADMILKVATDKASDLIIIGARGAGALARLATHFGSIAHKVVAHAVCLVLTVAAPRDESTGNELRPA